MEIEKIARKLQPLMPDEVRHWMHARDLAEPDMKALIDKQILSMAHRVLGDFRNKVLLSLPPEKKSKGTFHLGTVIYDDKKWPFGISRSELLQNLAIFGRSGAGKTNVAFHLLEQLANKKMPFLFLDWKRTGRHLIPRLEGKVNIYTPGRSLSPFPFNPFIVPPGIETSVYVNHLIDVLAEAYTLGDGSRSLLQRAITGCYQKGNLAPAVSDVKKAVEAIPDKQRVREWKISTIRALDTLAYADILTKDRLSQEQLVETLLKGRTIIELDGLSHGSKKFLVPLLCLWIYHVKLTALEREKLSLVVFIEEAHHVLYRQERRYKESVMNMLLRQCRELGIGIVVVDQHCHLISAAALGNTYTTICLNQKDPTDINRAAALSLVGSEDKKHLSMLPVGHGVVKLQDRWRRPFLVRFPLVHVKKGFVSDGVLKRLLDGDLTLSVLRKAVEPKSDTLGRILIEDTVLTDDMLGFVHDVLTHADDGVQTRYDRLGLTSDKGNKLKNQLVRSGILEAQIVQVGRGRKLMLRVAPSVKERLVLNSNIPSRGSIVHEYWKRFYAAKFREQGYLVQIEAPRYGRASGHTDVLARLPQRASESVESAGIPSPETVAIEVETGKSDVVSNVKQNLLAGIERVVVIATDQAALAKVERQLARANLIIPGRVEINLRDQ